MSEEKRRCVFVSKEVVDALDDFMQMHKEEGLKDYEEVIRYLLWQSGYDGL